MQKQEDVFVLALICVVLNQAQKPASKKEEVRAYDKKGSTGEGSKPKKAKISEEELQWLQNKVANLAINLHDGQGKPEIGYYPAAPH